MINNKENLDCIRNKIDSIYETQIKEIGGEKNLNVIGDQGFVMSLLSYDNFFVDYAVNNACLNIVEFFLGDYFQLFCQNAVINQINRSNDQIINVGIEISTIYILPHLDQLGLIYFSALTISKRQTELPIFYLDHTNLRNFQEYNMQKKIKFRWLQKLGALD